MITAAAAYCNNEVGYLAWTLGAKIPGCLGFEVTRVYLNADGTVVLRPDGSEDRVKTVALVAFKGQSNQEWNAQDTGVWPVQKLTWRDLTLRKRRDAARRRPAEVHVRYEIRPVGDLAPGLEAVPPNGRATVIDPATGISRPAYQGTPRPLGYLGAAVVDRGHFRHDPARTVSIDLHQRHPRGAVAVERADGGRPGHARRARRPSSATRGTRTASTWRVTCCRCCTSCSPGRARSTSRSTSSRISSSRSCWSTTRRASTSSCPTPARAPAGAWDERNRPAREELQGAGADVQPRMFNNSTHIGHNKFVVHVTPDGVARAVFTGSTNWTWTGVAGQTNNALLIEDDTVAAQFLGYWQRMHADELAGPESALARRWRPTSRAPCSARTTRVRSVAPLAGGGTVTTWFSPNMPQRRKPAHPPVPPDLQEVYRLMRLAQAGHLLPRVLSRPARQGLHHRRGDRHRPQGWRAAGHGGGVERAGDAELRAGQAATKTTRMARRARLRRPPSSMPTSPSCAPRASTTKASWATSAARC